ncbi:MAG: hypothetical protein EAZ57_08440 [Cytophagales bacterium]|nr:MAG: hypothetical protein EAZ67_05740 [Cytophagales bacterium]TAF60174.1 MAG: hypothetical protein EAZ57_08440 [Cytophagales bacterium]
MFQNALKYLPAGFLLCFGLCFWTAAPQQVLLLEDSKQLWTGFGFVLDQSEWQFMRLLAVVGSAVLLFTVPYQEKSQNRLLVGIFCFVLCMAAYMCAAHLLLLLFFWELLSFVSFWLIGFDTSSSESSRSAFLAFMMSRLSDVALLCFVGGFWLHFGHLNLLAVNAQTVLSAPTYLAWALLVAGLAKSAQAIFVWWLPAAMHAPTPVSALLHAASLVAAGVWLWYKCFVFWNEQLQTVMLYVGSCTVIVAAISVFFEENPKKLLAWSTVLALGCITLSFAQTNHEVIKDWILAHGAYKSLLFLCVGVLCVRPQNFSNQTKRLAWWFLCLAAILSLGLPLSPLAAAKSTILKNLHFKEKIWFWIILMFSAGLMGRVLACVRMYMRCNESTTQKRQSSDWMAIIALAILALYNFVWLQSVVWASFELEQLSSLMLFVALYAGFVLWKKTPQNTLSEQTLILCWQILKTPRHIGATIADVDRRFVDRLAVWGMKTVIILGHVHKRLDRQILDPILHWPVYLLMRAGGWATPPKGRLVFGAVQILLGAFGVIVIWLLWILVA